MPSRRLLKNAKNRAMLFAHFVRALSVAVAGLIYYGVSFCFPVIPISDFGNQNLRLYYSQKTVAFSMAMAFGAHFLATWAFHSFFLNWALEPTSAFLKKYFGADVLRDDEHEA